MSVVPRNTAFSILKAIAIVLVVMGHSGVPGALNSFAYMMHVPIFFLCAGYFFKIESLATGGSYFKKRITGIYLPFLRWSIALLLLHNIWFFVGVLNETMGNGTGVLHPYNWQMFSQRLWSIVFNMSGYDEFIGGSFWFFRAFFIASVGFWVLMRVLHSFTFFSNNARRGWMAVGVSVVLIIWMLSSNLRMTGVAQGGYRELTGLLFMSMGFLIREYECRLSAGWKVMIFYALLLVLFTLYWHSAMTPGATFSSFLALPLPALVGFLFWLNVAKWINRYDNGFKHILVYIGNNTIYVFAFHFLAFKLVSALKIALLGLPWEQLGAHPVIAVTSAFDPFFLLYTIVGIAVPLLVERVWRIGTANIHVPYDRIVMVLMTLLLKLCQRGIYWLKNIGKIGQVLVAMVKELGRILKETSRPSED